MTIDVGFPTLTIPIFSHVFIEQPDYFCITMHANKFYFLLMISSQEFARDRLTMELAREQAMSIEARRDARAKENSLNSAAVGASVGAGLGLVLAIVMGAASALRKP